MTPTTTTIPATVTPSTSVTTPDLRVELLDQARSYADASKATSTKKAYSSAWRVFTVWCSQQGQDPLPAHPTVVATFLADQVKSRRVATVEKYLAAINEAHRLVGSETPSASPQVHAVMKGIRRVKGTDQKAKSPLLVSHLRRIVQALPEGSNTIRTVAALLLGFSGAFRRSELVALDRGNIEFVEDGLVVNITRSKTDQEGAGRIVGVPYGSNPATCPVRNLKKWIEVSGIEGGPLFRSVDRHGRIGSDRLSCKSVCLMVKQAVAAIGLDPTNFGGHSLRAGLATEAARCGAGEVAIMAQTGHRSVATLRGYIRLGNLFVNNAAAQVGL